MRLASLFTLALVVSAPVFGQAVTPAAESAEQPPAAKSADVDKPEKVCRMERLTGSSMKRRVCLTEEQMRAHHATARQLMYSGQRRDSSGDGAL